MLQRMSPENACAINFKSHGIAEALTDMTEAIGLMAYVEFLQSVDSVFRDTVTVQMCLNWPLFCAHLP